MNTQVIDRLQAGEPIVNKNIAVVTVDRIRICTEKAGSGQNTWGYWAIALKQPYAIVICNDAGIQAYDMSANEIPVELLVETIPELDSLVASIRL